MRVVEEDSHEECGADLVTPCKNNGIYSACICYYTQQFDVNVGVLYCSSLVTGESCICLLLLEWSHYLLYIYTLNNSLI